MSALVIDGHPDARSLTAALAQRYADGHGDARVLALRDLDFDPSLRYGYRERMTLEPDLIDAKAALQTADTVVVATPLWWGSVPALLKGFFDRALLPQQEYRYTKHGLVDGLLPARHGSPAAARRHALVLRAVHRTARARPTSPAARCASAVSTRCAPPHARREGREPRALAWLSAPRPGRRDGLRDRRAVTAARRWRRRLRPSRRRPPRPRSWRPTDHRRRRSPCRGCRGGSSGCRRRSGGARTRR